MDDCDLRVKQIEVSLRATEKAAEFQVHRHVATLAVALTIGGSAALAWASGQLGVTALAVLGGAAGLVVASQLRALAAVASSLAAAYREAGAALGSLIGKEGETHVDASGDEPGV